MESQTEPQWLSVSLYSMYPDKLNPEIRMLSKHKKTGMWTWLSKKGLPQVGHPKPSEEHLVVSYVLNQNRMHDFGPMMKNKKQACTSVRYLSDQEETKLENTDPRRFESAINKKAIGFLREHYMVRVEDKFGMNENPNLEGSLTEFILVDESDLIRSETDKANKIHNAQTLLKDVYDNDPAAFTEICYAYSVSDSDIRNKAREIIFNDLWKKIGVDADEFIRIYEHKDRELLAAIKRASVTVGDKHTGLTIITRDGGYNYMDGQLLGESDSDMLAFFSTHPKMKDNLKRKLGIQPEIAVEMKELPKGDPSEIPPAMSDQQVIMKNYTDSANKSSVKSIIYKAFRNHTDEKITTTQLNEEIEKIKAKPSYQQFKEELDAFIDQKLQALK